MKRIEKFLIVCKKCQKKSAVNLVWHPNQAFIFACWNCNEAEGVKVKGTTSPTEIEEFIEEQPKCIHCHNNPATHTGGLLGMMPYCDDCEYRLQKDLTQ